MPDQPFDPLHYDMKIPPEPKDTDEEERHRAKKHGDKISTESPAPDTNANHTDEKQDTQSNS